MWREVTTGALMCYFESIALLKQPVREWSAWRIANADIEPELPMADLSEAHVAGGMPSFVGANITGANFTSIINPATGCYFTGQEIAIKAAGRSPEEGISETNSNSTRRRNGEAKMERKDYGDDISRHSMSGDEALRFLDGYEKGLGARDLVNEGAQLFMAGDYAGAEAKFKEAIAQNPGNAVAHGNIGNIHFKQRQYEKAVPWLEKALALDPTLNGAPECLRECRAQMSRVGAASPKAPSPVAQKPKTSGRKWWKFWG
jgi:tetratricopeptide (TPR) repeat protein